MLGQSFLESRDGEGGVGEFADTARPNEQGNSAMTSAEYYLFVASLSGETRMSRHAFRVCFIRSCCAVRTRLGASSGDSIAAGVRGASGTRRLAAVMLPILALASSAAAQCPASWVTGIGAPGPTSQVRALTVLPDGDVVAGGSFSSISGPIAAPNKFARYSFATGTWTAPATGSNSSTVYALAALPNGDVLLGGNFSSIGGVATRQFARYSFATNTFSGLGYGNNGGQVNAILLIANNEVIIGGNIPRVNGVLAEHVGRHNLTTGVWTRMNSDFSSSGDVVNSLALAPDGTVIVGGVFLNGGSVGAVRIARYHPTTNSWSTLGSGMNNTVVGVAVLPSGDVIAGGYFTVAGGVPVSRVARYNPGTNSWSDMAGGVSGAFEYVNDVKVLPDGDVVIGGSFTVAGGVPASRIARYHTSTNSWSAMGSGVNNDVAELTVLPVGDVIAGGFFTTAGGASAAQIARYTFGGDTPSITEHPQDVSSCPSGSVQFSVTLAPPPGSFTYQWQWQPVVPGAFMNLSNGLNIAPGGEQVDVQGATSSPLVVHALGTGGNFRVQVTSSCGSITSNLATLTICVADTDDGSATGTCDGGVTIDDLLYYLEIFEQGSVAADVDDGSGSGVPDGGVTIDDLIYYLTRFEGGC